MTPEEYQSARKTLRYNVSNWLEKLGIALDTHKKYNSGQIKIQAPVANHIETLLEYEEFNKSTLQLTGHEK